MVSGLKKMLIDFKFNPPKMQVICGLAFVITLLLAARDLHAGERNVLAWGDRGDDVKRIQKELKKIDLYEEPITGFYNRATVQAVREFQNQKKLTVMGTVDKKTRSLLLKSISKAKPANADILLLAKLIESEAADEPYLGKLAVGAVILNRVQCSSFPDTLGGVVFQPGAFESVQNAQFGRPVSTESRRAALEAWEGKDPTGNATYFWNPYKHVNPWVWRRQQVTQIGQHVFAK